jgi:hypothetical protein
LLLVAILGALALFGTFRLIPAVSGVIGGGGSTDAPSEIAPPTAHPSATAPQVLVVPSLAPGPTNTSPALVPTPGATPVGGGVGQIAYASVRDGVSQIYFINFDGSDPIQITDLADGACQPAWSPDGLRLAFTSPCDGNKETYPGAQIFVMNADGALTPMLTVPGHFDPAWSTMERAWRTLRSVMVILRSTRSTSTRRRSAT